MMMMNNEFWKKTQSTVPMTTTTTTASDNTQQQQQIVDNNHIPPEKKVVGKVSFCSTIVNDETTTCSSSNSFINDNVTMGGGGGGVVGTVGVGFIPLTTTTCTQTTTTTTATSTIIVLRPTEAQLRWAQFHRKTKAIQVKNKIQQLYQTPFFVSDVDGANTDDGGNTTQEEEEYDDDNCYSSSNDDIDEKSTVDAGVVVITDKNESFEIPMIGIGTENSKNNPSHLIRGSNKIGTTKVFQQRSPNETQQQQQLISQTKCKNDHKKNKRRYKRNNVNNNNGKKNKISKGRRALLRVSNRAYERRRQYILQHGYVRQGSTEECCDDDDDTYFTSPSQQQQQNPSNNNNDDDILASIFAETATFRMKRRKRISKYRKLTHDESKLYDDPNEEDRIRRFEDAFYAMLRTLANHNHEQQTQQNYMTPLKNNKNPILPGGSTTTTKKWTRPDGVSSYFVVDEVTNVLHEHYKNHARNPKKYNFPGQSSSNYFTEAMRQQLTEVARRYVVDNQQNHHHHHNENGGAVIHFENDKEFYTEEENDDDEDDDDENNHQQKIRTTNHNEDWNMKKVNHPRRKNHILTEKDVAGFVDHFEKHIWERFTPHNNNNQEDDDENTYFHSDSSNNPFHLPLLSSPRNLVAAATTAGVSSTSPMLGTRNDVALFIQQFEQGRCSPHNNNNDDDSPSSSRSGTNARAILYDQNHHITTTNSSCYNHGFVRRFVERLETLTKAEINLFISVDGKLHKPEFAKLLRSYLSQVVLTNKEKKKQHHQERNHTIVSHVSSEKKKKIVRRQRRLSINSLRDGKSPLALARAKHDYDFYNVAVEDHHHTRTDSTTEEIEMENNIHYDTTTGENENDEEEVIVIDTFVTYLVDKMDTFISPRGTFNVSVFNEEVSRYVTEHDVALENVLLYDDHDDDDIITNDETIEQHFGDESTPTVNNGNIHQSMKQLPDRISNFLFHNKNTLRDDNRNPNPSSKFNSSFIAARYFAGNVTNHVGGMLTHSSRQLPEEEHQQNDDFDIIRMEGSTTSSEGEKLKAYTAFRKSQEKRKSNTSSSSSSRLKGQQPHHGGGDVADDISSTTSSSSVISSFRSLLGPSGIRNVLVNSFTSSTMTDRNKNHQLDRRIQEDLINEGNRSTTDDSEHKQDLESFYDNRSHSDATSYGSYQNKQSRVGAEFSPERVRHLVDGLNHAARESRLKNDFNIIDTDGTTSEVSSVTPMDPQLVASLLLSPTILTKRHQQAIRAIENRKWEQVSYLLNANPWLAEMTDINTNSYLLHKLAFYGAGQVVVMDNINSSDKKRKENQKTTPITQGKNGTVTFRYVPSPVSLNVDLIRSFPTAVTKFDDCDGNLPLHWAAASANYEMIQLLGQRFPEGASVRNHNGMLPLHLAVLACAAPVPATYRQNYNDESNNNDTDTIDVPDIIKLVISFFPGAISVADNEGNLPIHIAASVLHGSIGASVIYCLLDNAKKEKLNPIGVRFVQHKSYKNKSQSFAYDDMDTGGKTFGDIRNIILDDDDDDVEEAIAENCLLVKNERGDTPLLAAIKSVSGWEIMEALTSSGPEARYATQKEMKMAINSLLSVPCKDGYSIISFIKACPEAVSTPNEAGILPIEFACMQMLSRDVILGIVMEDLPVSIQKKKNIVDTNQSTTKTVVGESWWYLTCACDDFFVDVVEEVVNMCTFPQILKLCYAKKRQNNDRNSHHNNTILSSATPKCKMILQRALRFVGRYEFLDSSPIEVDKSMGMKVFSALDYGTYDDPIPEGRRVLLYCYSQEDIYTKMVHVLRTKKIDFDLIAEIDAFTTNGDRWLSRSPLIGGTSDHKNPMIQKYFVSSTVPDHSLGGVVRGMLENVNFHHDPSIRKRYVHKVFSVLHIIAEGLENLHDAGLVHGDVNLESCGKYDDQWKLSNLPGSQLIGERFDSNRFSSSSAPPEAVLLKKMKPNKELELIFRSDMITHPSTDVWSFGKLSYEVLVGRSLFNRDESLLSTLDLKHSAPAMITLYEWETQYNNDITTTTSADSDSVSSVFTMTTRTTIQNDLLSSGVSLSNTQFILMCLSPDFTQRPTMKEILDHTDWNGGN